MSNWRLRRADINDAAGVTACVAGAFSTYIPRLGYEPAPMAKDYADVIAREQVWVAMRGDETIAAVVLDTTEEGFLIDVIAVHPTHQGTGAGRGLLELAEREARGQGHASIYLFTNEKMTENRALYARIGYVEYRRDVTPQRTRVYMRKPLPQ